MSKRLAASVRSEAFLRDAMRAWGPSVYSLALVQTGSRADAEDVYQDVFLRLATSEARFNDSEHLKAWLLRVAVNRCRDLARTSWFRRVTPFEDAPEKECAHLQTAPSAAEEATRAFETQELRRAVARLKPKLREVVYLHYAEELDCNEIAQLLETRPSTVRTRLQRARDQLRTTLGGTNHDEL